jgi:hypothetical protein
MKLRTAAVLALCLGAAAAAALALHLYFKMNGWHQDAVLTAEEAENMLLGLVGLAAICLVLAMLVAGALKASREAVSGSPGKDAGTRAEDSSDGRLHDLAGAASPLEANGYPNIDEGDSEERRLPIPVEDGPEHPREVDSKEGAAEGSSGPAAGGMMRTTGEGNGHGEG